MHKNKTIQLEWENTFDKKSIRKKIREKLDESEFVSDQIDIACEAINDHFSTNHLMWYPSKQQRWYLLRCMDITIDDIVQELFITVLLTQRSNIQGIIGNLVGLLEYKDPFDSVKLLSEIIAVVGKETNMFDIILPEDSELGSLTVQANYELDEEIKQIIADTMYLPPMLCKPQHIYVNYDFDYLAKPSSKILGKHNHHDNKIALDVLNIINSVPLMLDEHILQYDEEPNKELDTIEKIEQFNRMAKSSRKVYDMMLQTGNRFYNTHKYDKRGRLYSQGYHVHIQSTDYKKSLISLAEGEFLND